MAFAVPDPYSQAIRNGVSIAWSVSATRGGVPIAGAQNLAPTGGAVEDDASRDGRRSLSLELAPDPGLYALLQPTGTTLTVQCIVTYLNGRSATIPMGVFVVDSQNSGDVSGALRITAYDKWVRIKRARFMQPESSIPGILATAQLTRLIRGALGQNEPVTVLTQSQAKTGTAVWDRDRDKAITELAKSIGCWVYFDRYGVATIADVPRIGFTADWTIDASARGVLTSIDREQSRERTYNVVIASSSKADGGDLIDPQIAWDADPLSPTYAGPDPRYSPNLAGPFGIVPYFYESPLIDDASDAIRAARGILASTVGLASQVSLGAVPNPAIDAYDVIDVLAPQERYDIPRAVERHVVDKVTHSFDPAAEQRIQGRSTRSDDYS